MNRERAVSAGVWGLALAGAALRAVLAVLDYPMTGDPVFSYVYRAVLLAHGEWEGLTLLWHPPGYPLLLAGLARLTLGRIPPYWIGVGVSVISAAVLVPIVDRLVRPRVEIPATRLVVASFVAFYEGLYILAPAPLTEPPYLALVYGAVLLLDRGLVRETGAGRRVLAAGLLLGLATTLRLDGAAPVAGLALLVALWPGGLTRRRRLLSAALLLAGALLIGGWLAAAPEYLAQTAAAQRAAYTVPAASSLTGQATRAVEAGYHALVAWLPATLLLPYWCLVALGLAASSTRPRARLHGLLLAVVLPSLVVVTLTVMHKRTGAFLLPAAAIWAGLGVEALALRSSSAGSAEHPRRRTVVLALAIAMNLVQIARVPVNLARYGRPPDPVTRVAGDLLSRDRDGRSGGAVKVWAFGAEPEVYGFAGVPTVYRFFDREDGYNDVYRRHRGDPAGFVRALRGAGFDYLVFCLGPEGDEPLERQPYGAFADHPLRTDLVALLGRARALGLAPAGEAPADAGRCRVHLLRVAPDSLL